MTKNPLVSLVLVVTFFSVGTLAFTVPSSTLSNQKILAANTVRTPTTLFIDKKWFAPDESEDDGLVTREMLLRDMLEDPKVKRKRKGGNNGYKPLDNRDHLPFAVKKITPDPYTHPQIKKSKVKRTKSKKTDLDHHLLTNSRLYVNNNNDNENKSNKSGDSLSTLLGEFKLDKSTTSGDIIQIGDREYRVESARCQYKYAGGQRFVMVRKILEVKEVARALKEDLLMRQFNKSSGGADSNSTDSTALLDRE